MKLICGDCLEVLKTLEAGSVDCVFTSPPYWMQRNYGTENQSGREATQEEYVGKLVSVFAECKRVLKDCGTFFLNLGDGYGGKNLLNTPFKVCLALQADGWIQRNTVVWHKPNVTSTTGLVALQSGRDYLGIDCNAE